MPKKTQKPTSKTSTKPESSKGKGRSATYIGLGGSMFVSPVTGRVVETLAKVVKVPAPRTSPRRPTPRDPVARIEAALIWHLGSQEAADAWLDSPDTGYPTTARDAIRGGHAEYVWRDLQAQWGPNPPYA